MKTNPENPATDPLETRISAVPRREIPPEWRAQILNPCRAPVAGTAAKILGRQQTESLVTLGWLGRLFSPNGVRLWPALGIVWMGIFAAQLSLPKPQPQSNGILHSLATRGTPVDAETLRQVHQSLAQLMQRDAAPARPRPPHPPHLLFHWDRSRPGTAFLS